MMMDHLAPQHLPQDRLHVEDLYDLDTTSKVRIFCKIPPLRSDWPYSVVHSRKSHDSLTLTSNPYLI